MWVRSYDYNHFTGFGCPQIIRGLGEIQQSLKMILHMQSNAIPPYFNHFFLAVDCGPLSVPMNGSSSGNITVFPNSVQFNCDPGFILDGSVIRTCQANGTWSGFQTLCSGMLKAKIGESIFSLKTSYLNTSITKTTVTFVAQHTHPNVI